MRKIYYPRSVISTGSDVPDYKDHILSSVKQEINLDHSLYEAVDRWWIKPYNSEIKYKMLQGFLLPGKVEEFVDMYKNSWNLSRCIKQDRMITINYGYSTITGYMVKLIITEQYNRTTKFSILFLVIQENLSKKSIPMDEIKIPEVSNTDLTATITKPGAQLSEENQGVNDDFLISNITRVYSSKYAVTTLYNNKLRLTCFGSKPIQYSANLMIFEDQRIIDEDNNVDNIEKLFVEYLLNAVKIQSTDSKILFWYKNITSSGVITSIRGTKDTSDHQRIGLQMLISNESRILTMSEIFDSLDISSEEQ